MHPHPAIAILTPNILTGIGLKAILEKVTPMVDVELFTDFKELEGSAPERFYHFFVAVQLYRQQGEFFTALRRRVILLTSGLPHDHEAGMHTLNVFQSEEALIRDLTRMHHTAHPHRGQPSVTSATPPALLTEREIEVLRCLAHGAINKEIAEELGISLTTVITHRRNMMEKLQLRSVAELMLYAVRMGYVEADQL